MTKHETDLARARQTSQRKRHLCSGKVRFEVVMTHAEVEMIDKIKRDNKLQSRGAALRKLLQDVCGE